MSASGIPNSRNFSGRKTSCGLGLRSFGSNIRRSTKVAPGFRYAGQCVLLMVTTRSYMVSPPDAVAALPSAEAAGDLVQVTERVRKSAKVSGVLSSFAGRAFSDGRDVGRQNCLLRVRSHGYCSCAPVKPARL